jgi:CubicO group peptidase (beta-lactamase class C family)
MRLASGGCAGQILPAIVMPRNPTRRQFIGAALATGWGAAVARAATGEMKSSRLDEADRAIAARIATGDVSAAALLVRRSGTEFARAYGAARLDTPFLVASITKPMTASAVLWLRDRGKLDLADPVRRHLPEFTGGGDRERVTLRHLLTHTSGLPDMLPDNVALRQRHAPLADFVSRACAAPLAFPPGTRVSYQSMGYLLLGTIAERLSGRPLPALLRDELFTPLGMAGASLGLGGRRIADTAQCQVPPHDWEWNSAYWRNLGAPWGGAHATAGDVARFLEHFTSDAAGPLTPATRREMRAAQTAGLNQGWGLGWRRGTEAFAPACSAETFGHSGSTGVLAWRDPAVDLTFVLLTTKPAAESNRTLISPVSELVARG